MKNQIRNPFIFTKKVSYMQRISDCVRLGYNRYVEGVIPISKAGFFAAKMDYLYVCYADKMSASRMRKKGHSTGRLLFYHDGISSNLNWILLITEGDFFTPDSGNEVWRKPEENRITLTGYELVRVSKEEPKKPRKVKVEDPAAEETDMSLSRKKTGKNPKVQAADRSTTWTWRYTASRYKELREYIVSAIRRHRHDEVRQIIDTIWRSPAYRGVRKQVKLFQDLIKSEWVRTGVGELPEFPKGLGYVRRIPDKGKRLTDIQKEMINGITKS